MNMRRDSLDFMEIPVANKVDLSVTKSQNPPHPQFHRLTAPVPPAALPQHRTGAPRAGNQHKRTLTEISDWPLL
jgi:hypothetical protein